MTITGKYRTKCQACNAQINPGDQINWVKGVKGVTCVGCPAPRSTPANGTPVAPTLDPALVAALADGQALRARIGTMAAEAEALRTAVRGAAPAIEALRADVARMNAAARDAEITIEGLRKERDRLIASLTHTQNVLGNVQRERAALVAAGHNAVNDGPELIDVMAPGGVERWLEHDLAQIAAEKAATERQAIPVITDDDCPI
jgi:hypothetical protein